MPLAREDLDSNYAERLVSIDNKNERPEGTYLSEHRRGRHLQRRVAGAAA